MLIVLVFFIALMVFKPGRLIGSAYVNALWAAVSELISDYIVSDISAEAREASRRPGVRAGV